MDLTVDEINIFLDGIRDGTYLINTPKDLEKLQEALLVVFLNEIEGEDDGKSTQQ